MINLFRKDFVKSTRYTFENLTKAASLSNSIAGVLKILNIIPAGGNYFSIKRYIALYKIDTTHFKKSGWNKNKQLPLKRPISDYLENKHFITSHKLKLRLLREGFKEHKCEKCFLTKWLEANIPLELHHLNGNSSDNSLGNLQFLCPNCHALTDNYRGLSKKKKVVG